MKFGGDSFVKIRGVLCLVLVGLSSPAWADIYAYKDENGITHYSNDPSKDARYKRVFRIPPNEKSKPLNSLPPPQVAVPVQESKIEDFVPVVEKQNRETTDRAIPFAESPPPFSEGDSWKVLVALFAVTTAVLYFKFRKSSAAQNSRSTSPPPTGESSCEDQVKSATLSDAPPPAWCEVLGVSRVASIDEIRQAFRERMSEYHPDKVATLGVEIRDLAERKAKEINLSYSQAMRAKGIER
jgi:hypothetical protein